MKIALCCDVDAEFPTVLRERPSVDPWRSIGAIQELLDAAGQDMPVMTWFIRADESVRFATGDFASGFVAHRGLWERLAKQGHELGWHMHPLSRDAHGIFRFDQRPTWLAEAKAALSKYYKVAATRTGWDYGSNELFRALDALGITVDLSALPGGKHWFRIGKDTIDVDWLRCPSRPYHPSIDDYQRPGSPNLGLLEVPVARFKDGLIGTLRRTAWRLSHGCLSRRGLDSKTRLATQEWPNSPDLDSDILAFFFHPDELTTKGISNLLGNVRALGRLSGAEFIVASAAAAGVT